MLRQNTMAKIKEKGQGFWSEFKEFALKGNVVDLAVGIIIGGAFQTIVKSFVNDLVMPLLGLVTGGLDFSNRFWILKSLPEQADFSKIGDITYVRDTLGLPVLTYGSFVTAVLQFLIMSLVIFFMIKVLNSVKKIRLPLGHPREEEEAAPTEKECPFCCSTIPVDAVRCPHCTSELKEKDSKENPTDFEEE